MLCYKHNITAGADLYYMAGIVFVRLLNCKALLEESNFAYLTLKGWGIMLHLLEG